MKIIHVTSGPRGSGKSSYCAQVKSRHPESILLSRDEILISKFGKTSLNPYSGAHEFVSHFLHEKLEHVLKSNDVKVIYDVWNGYSGERLRMVRSLRKFGADRIECWFFVTPVEVSRKWFFRKPDVNQYSEENFHFDYSLYHREAVSIPHDGFDAVHSINPNQLLIPSFPYI